MALTAIHGDITFGVGDRVKVVQKIKESGKTRSQTFEGQVLGIKGREQNKSFTVRKIGVGQIGIERIYPLASPTIEKIEVVKRGGRGVRRAKLYYTREKAKKEIEKIYSRASSREETKKAKGRLQKTRARKKIATKSIKSPRKTK